jgi:adenylate cyclase
MQTLFVRETHAPCPIFPDQAMWVRGLMRTFEEMLDAFYTSERGQTTVKRLAEEIGEEATGRERCLYLVCRAVTLSWTGHRAEADEVVDRAVGEAMTLDDPGSIARALWARAIVHWMMGRYGDAMEVSFRALSVIENHNLRGKGGVLHNIGLLYSELTELDKAMEYYERALEEFQKDGNNADAIGTRGNISLCYMRAQQVERGLELLKEALDQAQGVDEGHHAANFTGNIGYAYGELGQYDLAEQYLRRAIDMAKRLDMSRERGYYTIGLASTMYDTGRHEEAINLLDAEHDMIAENVVPLLIENQIRARHMTEQGDHQGAIDLLKRMLVEVEERGERDHIVGLCTQLRDLCKTVMDFEGYVMYSERLTAVTAELNASGIERKIAIREKEAEFEEERRRREVEHERMIAERERERAVLYSTLPQSIAERVINGERVTDHFEAATVLFLDIVAFTSISDRIPAGHVVHLLSSVFNVCDDVCKLHGLTKVKTIGDSYMAVCGVPEPLSDHVARAAQASLDMIRGLATLQITMPPELGDTSWVKDVGEINVRIGLHTGPVVAGIVGTERLQYDVWGDTVNVASRMESNSEPGRINVSQSVYTALNRHDIVTFEPRGAIDVKGKGTMEMYFLDRKL